ncbi:hypothetical protein RIR_jg36568.t1 [Rhizophagus irregularis DAOM 181602=DAOM 197198]|nr:hypothetical protein RIR_jg36568.t1 [Rhizophagus irregularis DAOM 181602=DAOM 197198]
MLGLEEVYKDPLSFHPKKSLSQRWSDFSKNCRNPFFFLLCDPPLYQSLYSFFFLPFTYIINPFFYFHYLLIYIFFSFFFFFQSKFLQAYVKSKYTTFRKAISEEYFFKKNLRTFSKKKRQK